MASRNVGEDVQIDAEVEVQESVNPECPSSSGHQDVADHQSNSLKYAQTARPVLSDDDREYMKYLRHMPEELQEDNIDILIINAEDNQTAALKFQAHLKKDILFYVGSTAMHPRVKLLDEIRYGSADHLDLAFSKALFVFLYVTKEFCDDTWTVLRGQACLKEAIEDKDKKWSVIPIHTNSRKNKTYKLPMMLNSLRPINYWGGGEDQFYIDSVKKLLESKTGLLLERERVLDERRRSYFEANGHKIAKNIKHLKRSETFPRIESPAHLTSSISSSHIEKESNACKEFFPVSDDASDTGYSSYGEAQSATTHYSSTAEIPNDKAQPENDEATVQAQMQTLELSQPLRVSAQNLMGVNLRIGHEGSDLDTGDQNCEGSRILQHLASSNSEVNQAPSTSISNTSGSPVQTAIECNENVHQERVTLATRPTVSHGNAAHVHNSSLARDGPASTEFSQQQMSTVSGIYSSSHSRMPSSYPLSHASGLSSYGQNRFPDPQLQYDEHGRPHYLRPDTGQYEPYYQYSVPHIVLPIYNPHGLRMPYGAQGQLLTHHFTQLPGPFFVPSPVSSSLSASGSQLTSTEANATSSQELSSLHSISTGATGQYINHPDVQGSWPHGHITQAPHSQSNTVSQIPVTPSWQNMSAHQLQQNVSVSEDETSVKCPSSQSQAAKEVSETPSSASTGKLSSASSTETVMHIHHHHHSRTVHIQKATNVLVGDQSRLLCTSSSPGSDDVDDSSSDYSDEADEDAESNEEDNVQVLSSPELPVSSARSFRVDGVSSGSRASADAAPLSNSQDLPADATATKSLYSEVKGFPECTDPVSTSHEMDASNTSHNLYSEAQDQTCVKTV